eukprot:6470111-Amphidinium_carterae.1
MNHYDAIVIGAGAAGIAAARKFCESGLVRVVVLEARDRAGGRAHTSDALSVSGEGAKLDHGAQWIHGYSQQHPLVQLASEFQRGHRRMPHSTSETLLSDGRAVTASMSANAQLRLANMRKRVKETAGRLSQDCLLIYRPSKAPLDCSEVQALLQQARPP